MSSTAWQHEVTGADLARGFAAGVVGGLAATWVMTVAMAAERRVQRRIASRVAAGRRQRAYQHAWTATGGEEEAEEGTERPQDEGQEPATQKAAEAVSAGVLGHELRGDEKEVAGQVVHYAFGATMGGVYGVLAEVLPPVTIGAGMPFGVGLWLVADELAVPALGLTPPPHRTPLQKHAIGFGGHLAYGTVLEGGRRLLRALF